MKLEKIMRKGVNREKRKNLEKIEDYEGNEKEKERKCNAEEIKEEESKMERELKEKKKIIKEEAAKVNQNCGTFRLEKG
jgi:hypothetical protein